MLGHFVDGVILGVVVFLAEVMYHRLSPFHPRCHCSQLQQLSSADIH
jgi:hypothetical protein